MDGQEEVGPATDPPSIRRKRTAGDKAMNMRMMHERLTPCVENRQEPDLAAKVTGIGSDDLERCRNGIEQDRIDHCLVMKRDLGDLARYRENDVEIGHWQQIGLSVGKPAFARRTLALGAMPIAAGVIGNAGMRAVFTGLDMTTERRSPTQFDRRHDAAFHAADVAVMSIAISAAVVAEGDCQEFRVWAGIMGKKESHYVPTQGAGDSG